MTTAEASEASGSAVFELIAPFSESADARLRGNAVQALAALVGGQDKSLRQQAMDEIVRVMSAEPGGSGALDWQRRFAARCLDALARLQPAERQLVGRQILTTLSSTRERERRAAIARLSLAAMEHGRRFWTAGWMQWLRLARLAARSGFWITFWAVLWRTAVVWTIFGLGVFAVAAAGSLVPAKKSFDDLPYDVFGNAVVTTVILTILALLSVPGSIRLPLGICIADTAFSAIMLGLVTIDVIDELDWSTSIGPSVSLFLLGFVLGGAIRALRWAAIAIEIEPNGTAAGFRPLAALGVTTLVCIAVAWLGMDMRAAASGWMVLTPVTMTAAWLDVWLENSDPHPFSRGRARADGRWAIPVLAGSTILLSAVLINNNLKTVRAWDPVQAEPVQLPGGSDSGGRSTVIPGFGVRPLIGLADADAGGTYQIIVNTNPSERITLFLVKESSDHKFEVVTKQSGDELDPPTITRKLDKGTPYFICVMPGDEQSCWPLSGVEDLRHFDMLVITGNIGRKIDPRATHTIRITRSQ